MKTRAIRRHHRARLKHKRARYHMGVHADDPRRLGKTTTTPCPCSCEMCGNPRKHFGKASLQEQRAYDALDGE